jgi:hypothetical protein
MTSVTVSSSRSRPARCGVREPIQGRAGGTERSPAPALGGGPYFAEGFDDGPALFAAVCSEGLEGVVAKRRSERYRPGERRWIKTKNRDYWRYAEEVESLRRSLRSPSLTYCSGV